MTWEEIKPVAEAILGENCGDMTLDELAAYAAASGIERVSDMVKAIEAEAQRNVTHPTR